MSLTATSSGPATAAPGSSVMHASAQLAACERAAGIALRLDFVVFELRGLPHEVERAVAILAGGPVAAGSAAERSGVWIRPVTAHRALAAAPSRRRDRLVAALDASTRGREDIASREVSDDIAVIALAGPRAPQLARAVGGAGTAIGSVPDEDAASALVLAPTSSVKATWEQLAGCGAAFGAVSVDPSTIDLYWTGHRVVRAQRRGLTAV